MWDKVEEEINEMKEVIEENNQKRIEEEFGDVVFSLVNFARFLNIDAENALEITNKKFIDRFTQMEQAAQAKGRSLNDMRLEEMDAIWNEIKQHKG